MHQLLTNIIDNWQRIMFSITHAVNARNDFLDFKEVFYSDFSLFSVEPAAKVLPIVRRHSLAQFEFTHIPSAPNA